MSPRRENEQLVRESTWLRVYSTSPNHFRRESKFLSDGLQVSAESIVDHWSTFSLEQQLEFSLAYSAKPTLTADDEKILTYLMAVGPNQAWHNLALIFCRHPDGENVLRFLVARVEEEHEHRANYYQALERLHDLRAIPTLERQYKAYRESGALLKGGALNRSESFEMFDYLCCCRALLSLEGSPQYENAIKELLTHSDEVVSHTAKRLLSKTPPKKAPMD